MEAIASKEIHQSRTLQLIIVIAKQTAIRTVETFPTTPPRSRTFETRANIPEMSGKSAIPERLTGEILNYYNQSEATPSHLETNSLFPTSRRFLSRNRTKF